MYPWVIQQTEAERCNETALYVVRPKTATPNKANQADNKQLLLYNLDPINQHPLTQRSPHHLRPQAHPHHQLEVHLEPPLGRNERRRAAVGSSHLVPGLALVLPVAPVCAALGESRGRAVAYWTSWLRRLSPPL